MAQIRVTKPRRATDTRRKAREYEQEEQERPEVREDVRHWFKER